MDVCAVLYSKDKRTSQDNQDKKRSTGKVKRENERRNSEEKEKRGNWWVPGRKRV
jgi:hypothetical protein